jgi:hypothetical protein
MMRIYGYCPMGCGKTLRLDADGHIHCVHITCPDPRAIDKLLNDIRMRDTLREAVGSGPTRQTKAL